MPENGCVFYDAAPIFEISKSGNAAEEAAHIEYAQTTRDPIYKEKYSPGVFFAAPGTRAIANESAAGEQSMGLTRGEITDRALNNNQACKYTNSLIRTRPYSASSTCGAPTPSVCQCDEYPFAASREGAAFNPEGTSVRYIQGGENTSGGGQLIGFLKRERVFRGEKFWVRVIP
jgi:hypothetical protein